MAFTHYLALGDSISIDLYPSLDATKTPDEPLGAASLLAKHLRETHNPRLGFTNATKDGALIRHAASQALAARSCAEHGEGLLITLTAGGNDISFEAMSTQLGVDEFVAFNLPQIMNRWRKLLASLTLDFPGATIIVNTSYDPTEGTGTFGGRAVAGAWEDIVEYYAAGRGAFSRYVTNIVTSIGEAVDEPLTGKVYLADVREHFKGHGVTTEEPNRWYWKEFMIEPNAEGARQIAGLWQAALNLEA